MPLWKRRVEGDADRHWEQGNDAEVDVLDVGLRDHVVTDRHVHVLSRKIDQRYCGLLHKCDMYVNSLNNIGHFFPSY